MIKYDVKEVSDKIALVSFELTSGVITPAELPEAIKRLPQVEPGVGIILSGRGPIWLFAAMVHEYHCTPFVACYDPRLSGGIVAESHTPDVKVGDIIPV